MYPGIPGFEQSGGLQGPKGSTYNEHPEGDMALAEKYIKEAGYPSGKYTGGETITVVGAKGAPAEQDAEIVNQTLKNLGFKTKFSLPETLDRCTRSTATCPKKRSRSARAWAGSPTSPIRRPCSTSRSTASTSPPPGNVNWSQANIPHINEVMDKGELISGKDARATAWAKIDEELVKEAAADPVRLGQAGQRRG